MSSGSNEGDRITLNVSIHVLWYLTLINDADIYHLLHAKKHLIPLRCKAVGSVQEQARVLI